MAPHRRTKPTDSSSGSSVANTLPSTRSNRINRSNGSNGTGNPNSTSTINGSHPSRATSVAVSSGTKSRQGSQLPQETTSVAFPPTPPSQDDEDYDIDFDGLEDSGSTPNQNERYSTPNHQHRRPNHTGSMSLSGAYPLQRGSACLSCRKRKLKCSGSRPVCEQCAKANRAADCEFDDGKAKTRTQMLQEKIMALESRIRELETNPPASVPVPVPISIASAPTLSAASSAGIVSTSSTSASITQGHVLQLQDPSYRDNSSSTFNTSEDRFNFEMIVDRPLNQDQPLGYNFGSNASSSSIPPAPSSYEQHQLQLQLSQVIDAACGDGSSSVTVPSQQPLSVSDWPHPHSHAQSHAQSEQVPAQLRQLLETVLPHFSQLGLDLQPSAFLQSLNLPANHPLHPHPSLLNALYLHACALSPLDHYLHSYQNRFLQQTRRAINESLQFNDRIIDTLRAQCLLATWYFGHGRMLEGYDVVCAASRFAVGCELNRIISPVWSNAGNINTLNNINNIHNIGNVSAEALAAENRNREPSQQGLGIGLPALAATAATSGSGPNVTDRDGNLTHPRFISLNFGIGLLPTASIAVTRDQHPQHQYQSGRASPAIPLSNPSSSTLVPGAGAGASGVSVACSKINPIIDAPRSAKELGERILLFWRIFNLDRFWSVVCGLQPALSEDEIMTVWPRSIEDYETGNVSDNEYASVRSLGVRRPSNSSAMRPDSKAALLSKSITLFERSARLAASLSSVQPPTEAFWVAFRLMEDSISQMINSLSPYRRRSVGNIGVDNRFGTSSQSSSHRPSPSGSVQGESSPSSSGHGQFPNTSTLSPLQSTSPFGSSSGAGAYEVDSTLVLVHILLRSAAVQLHNIFAQEDPSSYQKTFAAARAAATIIGEVAEVIRNVDACNLMLGPCLALIADVLIREATRGTMSSMSSMNGIGGMMNPPNSMNTMGSMGGSGGMENIDHELDAVLFMLNAIGHKYPLVRRQASLVEAAKEVVITKHRHSQQLGVGVGVGVGGIAGVNVGMPMSIHRMSY